RIVAGIVNKLGPERRKVAAEWHRRFRGEIDPPHRDRVEAEAVGDRIEQSLAHEAALETAGGAVGAAWRLVGQPHMADRAVGWDDVRSRQHCGGEVGDRYAVRADIGALVEPE